MQASSGNIWCQITNWFNKEVAECVRSQSFIEPEICWINRKLPISEAVDRIIRSKNKRFRYQKPSGNKLICSKNKASDMNEMCACAIE